jgi:hypothetical protein
MKSLRDNIENLRMRALGGVLLYDKGYVRDKVRQIIREEFMWTLSDLSEVIKHEINSR